MKKETFTPYIGKEIAVKDLFGDVNDGKLESVDDDKLVLVVGAGKKEHKVIVATQYVSSFEAKA